MIENKAKAIKTISKPIKKNLKKSHLQFSTVMDKVDAEIRKKDPTVPDDVGAFAYTLIREGYKIATTTHKDEKSMLFCQHCKQPFKICCTKCGKPNTIEVDSAELLKAKIPVVNKLIDKLAPNLQSTNIDVKFDIVFEKISRLFIDVVNNEISDVVTRKKYMNKLDDTISDLMIIVDKDL